MKVINCKTETDIANEASKIICDLVKEKSNAVIGFATGGTPKETYTKIIADHIDNGTDWSNVKTFNLDEYIGIDKMHPQSYHTFMTNNLFNSLNIKKENINFPETEGDIESNISKYEKLIEENKIDIQILGIGTNGHIAFNEPGTSFESITHVTNLTDSTIKSNSRFFDSIDQVPTTAVTMGIGTILKSKKIILLAYGLDKADAIKELVEGNVDEAWPCTALQSHPDVTVIIDYKASSGLEGKYD